MSWVSYKNGNYTVRFNTKNGTKIRMTEADNFIPSFAENMDVKITDRCDGGCAYCFPAGTRVLMGDFTTKNIEDVQIGDEVIGFDENVAGNGNTRKMCKTKVIKTFCHVEEELVSISTEFGKQISATPNHPFLSEGTGKNHSRYFNAIGNLSEGRYVFALDFPLNNIDYNNEDYKKGYVIGAWMGDGTATHNIDKNGYDMYLCRFVTKDNEINEQVLTFTNYFLKNQMYYNTFNMKGLIINTSVTNASSACFYELNDFIYENFLKCNSKEYACGYLAGIFDTEGHIDNERGTIRIANTNYEIIQEIERCLDILHIEYVEEFREYTNGRKNIWNVRIRGRNQWNNFLWYTRPICKRKAFDPRVLNNCQYTKQHIIKKEYCYDKQYVYNLATESRTYVANNFLVHNCYEGCTEQGKHADLMNAKWVDTLHPYTELAINGNDLTHPQLVPFLKKLQKNHIITNMTVNQVHFEKNKSYIHSLVDNGLIHGIGISLRKVTPNFIASVKEFPTAVIHVINGICTPVDFLELANNDLTILILGYKNLRRGTNYLNDHTADVARIQSWTYDHLGDVILKGFKTVSFDNLALEQLNVKNHLSDEQWEEFFMGQDGAYTYYIDMVGNEFSRNSLSTERFPIMDDTQKMFDFIRDKYNLRG